MKLPKDRPILNYIKMKWERYPLVITVIGMLFSVMLYFAVSAIVHWKNDKQDTCPTITFKEPIETGINIENGYLIVIEKGKEVKRYKYDSTFIQKLKDLDSFIPVNDRLLMELFINGYYRGALNVGEYGYYNTDKFKQDSAHVMNTVIRY